jgi:hypothetical protein
VSIGTGAINQAIAGGGTGYTVGNILTVSGGTFINSAQQQIRVDAVSGGVITGISVSSFGQYTTLPTNPVSVTGGSGSGATFNLSNYSYVNHLITNAGSGYIEQPTVTFSGGGGSGAAAYATVGSNTIVRSLGNNLNFNTPSGTGFGVSDAGATSAQWWQAIGGAFTGILRSTGSTQGGLIQTGGTGSISLQTNNGAQTQLVVAHTASAVNYVQVTGSATTVQPVISAQGSDANVNVNLTPKGTGTVLITRLGLVSSPSLTIGQANNGLYGLGTGEIGVVGSGWEQFRFGNTSSAVNFLRVNGNVAGSAPILSAQGTDTDIDLTLTPKGTGRVRFGTYTGTILTPTGFIEVKDSGGTVRRLLVG